MFGRKSSDVLVVGAGPVGLYAALNLARRGVSVKIVDKEQHTGTHSYALALHPGSLQLLEECGVLGELLEDALHVRRVGLYEGAQKRAELSLSGLADDYSFVAVTRQADLERHLEAALERAGGRVLWSHGVHQVRPGADQVSVTLDKYSVDTLGYSVQHTAWVVSKTRELEFPFVIGADGIRSTVRNRLAIGFPEVATAADFAVFEFKTDADLGDEMRLVFTADSTNVCWPLPDGYCRWSFQIPRDPGLTDPREKERHFGIVGGGKYPVLDEQHLHDFLAQRAPWFKGSVEAVRWQMEVRFENRLAESFGEGRVWLAGDAGHATGPGGVQSMNVGLREAHDLAGIVAGVLGGEASLEAFGQYQHARREEWTRLLEFDQGLLATRSTDPWVAGIRKRLLPCIPASGEDLEQLAAQVGLEAAWV